MFLASIWECISGKSLARKGNLIGLPSSFMSTEVQSSTGRLESAHVSEAKGTRERPFKV